MEEELKENKEKKRGFWYWIKKNFYPMFLIFSSIIIVLTISLILLTKSQWFRYWVSGFVFTTVNNELQEGAKFEFKDIGFSYLLGIKLYDVRLTYNGEIIFYSKEFDAGIKIAPLFRNKIIVNEVMLDSPKINFYRSAKDSLWVIEKIILPSPDTTPSEPAEWMIQVKKIRFKNGDLRFFDSTIAYNKSKKLDFDHFRLKSFYLNMKAEIDLLKSKYMADIKELSFYDAYSGIKIKEMQMTAGLDSSGLNIEDMFIRTNKSEFETNANISRFNIFTDADIEKARFKVEIISNGLNIDDISRFVPADIPATGNYCFDMQVHGTLKDMFVMCQDLEFGKSDLNFSAFIKNIQDEKRVIEFDFEDSKLLKNNLDEVIRKLEITGIPDFGDMVINEFKGMYRTDTLFALIDINSSLGKIKGEAGVGLKDTLSYSGKIKMQNLDLSKILLDESLTSNINSDVYFSGSGDSPEILKFSINMNMVNSKIQEYSFNNFLLDASTQERGKIVIDTLLISFGEPLTDTFDENEFRRKFSEKISIKGFLDVHDMNIPKYDLLLSLNNINPAQIFNSKDLLENLEADIAVAGKGFEPDSMNTSLKFNIAKWKYNGKNLTPLNMAIAINRDENNIKTLKLISNFANVNLTGKFNYLELIDKLQYDLNNFSNFVTNKIEDIFPSDNQEIAYITSENNDNHNEQNFDLSLSLKDSEIIKTFLKFNKFECDLKISMNFKSGDSTSVFNFQELRIDKLIYDDGENLIRINPAKADGTMELTYSGNSTFIPELNLNLINNGGIVYNDLVVTEINTKIGFFDNRVKLSFSAELNDLFHLSTASDMLLNKEQVDVNINAFDFKYFNKIEFRNEGPILLKYLKNEINIEKFKLLSDKLKQIELKGLMGENYFKNIKCKLYDYNLEHIWDFIPRDEIELDYELKGNVDTLAIGLNGSFEKTDIDLNINIGKLSVGESFFGNIAADIKHRNSVLSGDVRFFNPLDKTKKNLLKLTLGKIPVNMSLDAEGDRFYENNPIAFSLETYQFPLKVLSPFVSELKNLTGFADISMNINGDGLKNIKYDGLLSYNNTQFLLETNNMIYSSEGKIKITTDTITVEKILLRNNPTDVANGEALAKGKIILKNLSPKEFDVKVFSNRFKILSQASMKSMPSLYGDFVLSFGPRPMRFFGSLDSPYLTGDVNILRAALTMPNTSSTEVKKSVLKYEIKSDSSVEFTLVPEITTTSDLNQKTEPRLPEKKTEDKSFGDLLDIDIGIKFKGRFVMTMDITGIGQLFAEIGTQNPDDELRYVMKRGADEPQVYGADIIVKDGSTLKLIKMLDTKGMVSFGKGIIDNPGLDLVATYNGQRILPDKQEKYKVNMYIKGTKDMPIVSFGYSIEDEEKTGDSSKINEDALLLLTLGKTKEELQNSQSSGGFDYMASASSLASTMASSALTDFVQASSFIQSADIDIGSSLQNLDQARMKFSGDIKGIKWTLGGTVSQFASNNEISIDIPVSSVLNIKGLNIVLQLTKVTASTQSSTTKNQKDWEIKFKLGGSW